MASPTKSPSATSTNKPEDECSPPLRAATNRKPRWMEKSDELLRAPKRALPTSRVYGTIDAEPESQPRSDDNNNSGHGSKRPQSDSADSGTGLNTQGNKYSHPSESKKIKLNSEDDVELGESGGNNNNQRTITKILPLKAELDKPSPSRRRRPPPPAGCGVDA